MYLRYWQIVCENCLRKISTSKYLTGPPRAIPALFIIQLKELFSFFKICLISFLAFSISSLIVTSNFTGKIDNGVITGFQHVLDNLNKIRILDVRSKEEFSGEIVRAARSGHIPTSTNVDWAENITRDGTLKNNEDLSKLYNLPKDAEIVTYCQGGYRAANTYLALKKIGFTNVMVYLGSWGEWGNMLELPAE